MVLGNGRTLFSLRKNKTLHQTRRLLFNNRYPKIRRIVIIEFCLSEYPETNRRTIITYKVKQANGGFFSTFKRVKRNCNVYVLIAYCRL